MRGRRYAVSGSQAISSPDDTMLGITGGTGVRPILYEFAIGENDTPADTQIQWSIQRSTAAGTSTAVTPAPLDSNDPASTTAAGQNHTAEPTYTASTVLWQMPLNLRASHRWIADPDGGFIVPATANNGLGLYPTHASSTVLMNGTLWFQE